MEQVRQRRRLILHIDETPRDRANLGLGSGRRRRAWRVFRPRIPPDISLRSDILRRRQIVSAVRPAEVRLHHLLGRLWAFVRGRIVAGQVLGHASCPVNGEFAIEAIIVECLNWTGQNSTGVVTTKECKSDINEKERFFATEDKE